MGGWERVHPGGAEGCWPEQEVRPDHWHRCRPPSQEQERGVPAAERSAPEGIQVQADLVPSELQEPRKGDSTAEELSKAVQLAGAVMPVKPVFKRARAMEVTDDLKKFQAFQTIRQARSFKRLHGIRAKRAADAEADELSKKK